MPIRGVRPAMLALVPGLGGGVAHAASGAPPTYRCRCAMSHPAEARGKESSSPSKRFWNHGLLGPAGSVTP